MSDGWASYSGIEDIDGGIYEHHVVIHQSNFVDPNDRSVHTQLIENTWMRAKRKLRRQCGTSEELFPSYIHEFIWRNQYRPNNIFSEFIIAVNEHYQV